MRSEDVVKHNRRYQHRYHQKGRRRTNLLRRTSDAIAIATGIAALTWHSGHPLAQPVAGSLLLVGMVLALLQYGRGYRRATWALIAACLAGVTASHMLWSST